MERCICNHLKTEHEPETGICENFSLQLGGCPCEKFRPSEQGQQYDGPQGLKDLLRF